MFLEVQLHDPIHLWWTKAASCHDQPKETHPHWSWLVIVGCMLHDNLFFHSMAYHFDAVGNHNHARLANKIERSTSKNDQWLLAPRYPMLADSTVRLDNLPAIPPFYYDRRRQTVRNFGMHHSKRPRESCEIVGKASSPANSWSPGSAHGTVEGHTSKGPAILFGYLSVCFSCQCGVRWLDDRPHLVDSIPHQLAYLSSLAIVRILKYPLLSRAFKSKLDCALRIL